MARKAWDELTPAYQARLERAGVTAESHAHGAPIRDAVGHGWQLPSMHARYERVVAREMSCAAALNKVPSDVVRSTIDSIGTDRAAVVIDWQTKRTALGKGVGGPLTFEVYIAGRFGEDAWDDDWQEIYDELDSSWDYYGDI